MKTAQSPVVAAAAQAVGEHLDAILGFFKPGVKITLVVRSPGFPDRDFIMSTDELEGVIQACRRRNGTPEED